MQTIDGMLVLMQFAYIEEARMLPQRVIHMHPDMMEEDTPQYAGIIGGELKPVDPDWDVFMYDLEDGMVNGMVFLIPE